MTELQTRTKYVYDGDGKRVAKSFGGSVNKIYWYGPSGEVLDETDGTGSILNSVFDKYIFFGGSASLAAIIRET